MSSFESHSHCELECLAVICHLPLLAPVNLLYFMSLSKSFDRELLRYMGSLSSPLSAQVSCLSS